MAKASTITQDVYDKLRADLLSCRLAPGDRLRIEVLCHRVSAGSSAVREALSRLASEGFVTMEPQRGFRVTPLSFAELRDLTATRCQIEALCIRNAVAHADVEWEAGVVTALHRLARTPKRAEDDSARYNDAFGTANALFHAAVAATCRSPSLLQIREMLLFRQERYLWLSMPLAKVERDVHAEHEAIARAALARDAEATVEATASHLQRTADIILSSCVADDDLAVPNPSRMRVA